jgi:hypothetical protein
VPGGSVATREWKPDADRGAFTTICIRQEIAEVAVAIETELSAAAVTSLSGEV